MFSLASWIIYRLWIGIHTYSGYVYPTWEKMLLPISHQPSKYSQQLNLKIFGQGCMVHIQMAKEGWYANIEVLSAFMCNLAGDSITTTT